MRWLQRVPPASAGCIGCTTTAPATKS